MLSFFPRGVLDEILNLIESVSEEFPSYFRMVPSFSLRPDLLSCNRIRRVRFAVILSFFNLLSVPILFPMFIRVGKKSLSSPTAGLAFHDGPFSITVFIGMDCSAAIGNIFVSF